MYEWFYNDYNYELFCLRLVFSFRLYNQEMTSSQILSNYAKRISRLSAKIFGEISRPTSVKSLKVTKLFSEEPVYQRASMVDYYPKHPEIGKLMRHLRFLGLYRLVKYMKNNYHMPYYYHLLHLFVILITLFIKNLEICKLSYINPLVMGEAPFL